VFASVRVTVCVTVCVSVCVSVCAGVCVYVCVVLCVYVWWEGSARVQLTDIIVSSQHVILLFLLLLVVCGCLGISVCTRPCLCLCFCVFSLYRKLSWLSFQSASGTRLGVFRLWSGDSGGQVMHALWVSSHRTGSNYYTALLVHFCAPMKLSRSNHSKSFTNNVCTQLCFCWSTSILSWWYTRTVPQLMLHFSRTLYGAPCFSHKLLYRFTFYNVCQMVSTLSYHFATFFK